LHMFIKTETFVFLLIDFCKSLSRIETNRESGLPARLVPRLGPRPGR
jgi:hypothetical protein